MLFFVLILILLFSDVRLSRQGWALFVFALACLAMM